MTSKAESPSTPPSFPGPFFSDIFDVDRHALKHYGAFDISLINDLPLFVDPFLLFHSDKPAYRALHNNMIDYLRFLRDNSAELDPPEPRCGCGIAFPRSARTGWAS